MNQNLLYVFVCVFLCLHYVIKRIYCSNNTFIYENFIKEKYINYTTKSIHLIFYFTIIYIYLNDQIIYFQNRGMNINEQIKLH